MPRKSDSITVAELRAIMRKFNIPGSYQVTAENKASFVDVVASELEKHGISCESDSKTIVTVVRRLDTKCGKTNMPYEQSTKVYVVDDVDIAEMIRKLVLACEKGYCTDKDVTFLSDGRLKITDHPSDAKELREAGIKVNPRERP